MIFWKIPIKPGRFGAALMVVLICILLLVPANSRAENRNLGSDKIAHFWFSFLICRSLTTQTRSEFKGLTYTIGVGVLKEITDFLTGKKFDGPDLLFDLLGTAAGVGIKL